MECRVFSAGVACAPSGAIAANRPAAAQAKCPGMLGPSAVVQREAFAKSHVVKTAARAHWQHVTSCGELHHDEPAVVGSDPNYGDQRHTPDHAPNA